jgi:hypothetical protein
MNCKKYDNKRQYQLNTWLKNCPVILWFHIIGDESIENEYEIDEKNHLLKVNTPDNYISLPKKIYLALKAIYDSYKNITHILKTDDDMDCNISELSKYMNIIPNYDYGGFKVHVTENIYSTYHYHSSDDKTPSLILAGSYVNGRFYFLSRNLIEHILKQKELFWTYIYEDNIVGCSIKNYNNLKFLEIPDYHIFFEFPHEKLLSIVKLNLTVI